MLLRKNLFTNKKYRISNNFGERGGSELLAVLAQASGKTQEKVTSAQILRLCLLWNCKCCSKNLGNEWTNNIRREKIRWCICQDAKFATEYKVSNSWVMGLEERPGGDVLPTLCLKQFWRSLFEEGSLSQCLWFPSTIYSICGFHKNGIYGNSLLWLACL